MMGRSRLCCTGQRWLSAWGARGELHADLELMSAPDGPDRV